MRYEGARTIVMRISGAMRTAIFERRNQVLATAGAFLDPPKATG
jgi:hypothetical protein